MATIKGFNKGVDYRQKGKPPVITKTLIQEQIKTPPQEFSVGKWFGPMSATIILPDDILNSLIKMTDGLIEDEKTQSMGPSLAGVIDKELKIYKQDIHKAGCDGFLEACLRNYVDTCAKEHASYHEDNIVSSAITSCWTVSQHENEYNPVHNHTGCQVSAVLYLKIPKDIKGRRKLPSKEGRQDNDGDINFIYSSDSQRPGDVLNRGITQFVPLPGMLAIFPSYLLHTVYPFIGEGERRSIAFNACYTIKSKEGQYVAGDTSEFNPYETFYGYEKPK